MKSRKTKQPDGKTPWMRYLGLGTQMMAALALSLWAGIWIDRRLGIAMPLLVWILPLLVIAVTIVKLVKETAIKPDGEDKYPQ